MIDVAKIGAEVTRNVHAEGERRGQNRRRERRKKERYRGDDHQLHEEQRNRLQQRRVERRGLSSLPREFVFAPRHVGKNGVQRHRHDDDVDGERQHQAGVLANDDFVPANRLGQEIVDAPPLDFLEHQSDPNEYGDEEPENGHGRQSEVLDDLQVLPGRQLTEDQRRAHQQNGERDQVVEHFVADRFAEAVDRDPAERGHVPSPTCWTKKSSSVS